MKRHKEKKYNYTYVITNLVNNKIYYGTHSTDDLNDGYMGSGTLLAQAKKKYGKKNFNLSILGFYKDFKSARDAERELVTIDVVNDPMTYNLKIGGEGRRRIGYRVSSETKEKISKAQKGKPKHLGFSDVCRKAQLGKKQSEETKAKRKEALLNNPYGYNRNKPSHKRDPIMWDNIEKIKEIWENSGKPGAIKLKKLAIEAGFPNKSYARMLEVFRGTRTLL